MAGLQKCWSCGKRYRPAGFLSGCPNCARRRERATRDRARDARRAEREIEKRAAERERESRRDERERTKRRTERERERAKDQREREKAERAEATARRQEASLDYKTFNDGIIKDSMPLVRRMNKDLLATIESLRQNEIDEDMLSEAIELDGECQAYTDFRRDFDDTLAMMASLEEAGLQVKMAGKFAEELRQYWQRRMQLIEVLQELADESATASISTRWKPWIDGFSVVASEDFMSESAEVATTIEAIAQSLFIDGEKPIGQRTAAMAANQLLARDDATALLDLMGFAIQPGTADQSCLAWVKVLGKQLLDGLGESAETLIADLNAREEPGAIEAALFVSPELTFSPAQLSVLALAHARFDSSTATRLAKAELSDDAIGLALLVKTSPEVLAHAIDLRISRLDREHEALLAIEGSRFDDADAKAKIEVSLAGITAPYEASKAVWVARDGDRVNPFPLSGLAKDASLRTWLVGLAWDRRGAGLQVVSALSAPGGTLVDLATVTGRAKSARLFAITSWVCTVASLILAPGFGALAFIPVLALFVVAILVQIRAKRVARSLSDLTGAAHGLEQFSNGDAMTGAITSWQSFEARRIRAKSDAASNRAQVSELNAKRPHRLNAA